METKSSDKNPVDDFKAWALKLGCPIKALPSDAALNRFMKSNHANVQKLMDHVRPKDEVKLNKDNLLLDSLTNSNLLLERSESYQTGLPNKLKNIKKVEKLNHQIGQLKPQVEQMRTEFKQKQSSLLRKGDQLMKAKKILHDNQTKCIQLEQKNAQIIEKMNEEKKFEAMLGECMSVQVAVNPDEKKIEADKAIKKAIQLLRNVYDEIGDREFSVSEKEKVQLDLQRILSGIPVSTLFEAMTSHNDREMKAVDVDFASINTNSSEDSTNSAFDIAIIKARMRYYVDHVKTKKLKEEHAILVEQYVKLYDEYLNKIINEMKLFNVSDDELFAESICGDYLKQLGTWMCNQAMLQYYQEKVADWQRLTAERDDQLKGNEVVSSELNALYGSIEKSYNVAMDEIEALGDVNKSIKQLQALSKYTINNFGSKSIWNKSASMLNCTLGSTVPSITINLAPAEYLNEISMLVDVAYDKWNKLPLQILMDIEPQPSQQAIMPFSSLVTPNTALNDLELEWEWHKVIDVLTKPLDVDKEVPQAIDVKLALSNLNDETIKMLKSIEDINFMRQTGSKTVSEIQKYLAFLLDTSLGSFIPDNVKVNRRNFLDYEAEFLCACSLISNSLKKL